MASVQCHTRCRAFASPAHGAAPRSVRPLGAPPAPSLRWAPEPAPAAHPRATIRRSAAPDAEDAPPETVFYEGSGSNAELAINVLLGATLVYLPLTMSAVGRRLWITYRFTDRRVVVETNSPVLKRSVEVPYDKIREIRTAPRAFGLWGDCVIFLKDGSRLELVGLERFDEIRDYVEGFITD